MSAFDVADPSTWHATPLLADFLAAYKDDDNIWWRTDAGHHLNLFDAAIEERDEAVARVRELEAVVARVHGDCAPDCAERITCTTVGAVGHWQCGWCGIHDQPRHECGDFCLVATDPEVTS